MRQPLTMTKNSATTRRFYATVQNKMHYAVHGHTAAELIMERADHTKEHMGLTTWEMHRKERLRKAMLAALGIPASNAINMFYKQIILQRGLPFEVKMPSAHPVDVSALSEAQMNAELEKGYADMQAGRTRSAKSDFC